MVEIKIRKGEIGKCHTNIDVNVEGYAPDIYWNMIELEEAVVEILTNIEENSTLQVKDAFITNLCDRLSD